MLQEDLEGGPAQNTRGNVKQQSNKDKVSDKGTFELPLKSTPKRKNTPKKAETPKPPKKGKSSDAVKPNKPSTWKPVNEKDSIKAFLLSPIKPIVNDHVVSNATLLWPKTNSEALYTENETTHNDSEINSNSFYSTNSDRLSIEGEKANQTFKLETTLSWDAKVTRGEELQWGIHPNLEEGIQLQEANITGTNNFLHNKA